MKAVSIEVGPEKTKYFVHKELLCQKSRYFDKAFNSGFREAIKQSITLADEDPTHMKSFVTWVYAGDFGNSNLGGIYVSSADYDKHLGLFFLADAYDAPALRAKIIDTLFISWHFRDGLSNSRKEAKSSLFTLRRQNKRAFERCSPTSLRGAPVRSS